jgi:1-acyl-sn-glycerol-3-phosphate acyltransferase
MAGVARAARRDAWCLSARSWLPDGRSMPAILRRLLRLALLLLLAVAGILTELVVFPMISASRRRAIIRHWSRDLMSACGLQVRVGGSVDGGGVGVGGRSLDEIAPGCMLVANHVSWLDIFAINSLATSAFVAKAELRRWPVAGWLAALAGTVFIERARRHAVHQVIEQLRHRIRQGFPVAVFPEATTTDGSTLLPFYGNLLEAAIAEEARIIPIALRYLDAAGKPAAAAAYVGETTFVESLWMVLGERELVVDVQVLAPVPTAGRNRHELARELRALISARLALPPADTPPGTPAGSRAASR